MENKVQLHGTRSSPYSCRVIWALELKGIPYEFIEEDVSNKSPLLLKYNPVYKKIPVLVHGGKPICESGIILQYIDETWPDHHPLLPKDPHERASARFWLKYADEKVTEIWSVSRTTGEELEKAVKNGIEILKTLEDHALGEKKFFGGEKIGIVDLTLGPISFWIGILEDVVGVKLLEPHSPRLLEWTKNFKQVPEIKENLPDSDKLTAYLKNRRAQILGSA